MKSGLRNGTKQTHVRYEKRRAEQYTGMRSDYMKTVYNNREEVFTR